VFNNPQGLAVDGQGNVYIADQSNGRVKKVDRQGSLSTVAGTSLPSSRRVETTDGGPAVQGLLDLPSHVAVDAAGNLYILDGTATGADSSYRIRKVGTDGILSTLVGPTIPLDGKTVRLGASDIAIDSAGNLFVADGLNNRVHKITPER
jgi:hypothetical protein